MSKTFVIIPTYNEAENIEQLVQEIMALALPDLTVLVVDDNSPDGTGSIADRLARDHAQVRVIHRTGDRGRGLAGIAGFKSALNENADLIIEMDGDLSHQPAYLPDLISAARHSDVVIGSRFIAGGQDIDRSPARRLVTMFARQYIRSMLDLKVKDITSGYRCFRRQVLEAIDLDSLISKGPSIVSELLYLAHLNGFTITEVPIIFKDRTRGRTKLNLGVLLKTLLMVYRFKRIYA
jgi:dolichol-phosphate mannosyltransferase